jgi:hypothetical protein
MRRVTCLAAVSILAGCAQAVPPPVCAAGMGTPMTVFTLYFGQSVAGRPDVTDAEWDRFRDGTITPNLPDGYTVWDARGAWMNPRTRTTIKEPSKVLAVALPAGPAGLVAVNRVREAYQRDFHQQAVGLTSAEGCGAF